MNAIIREPKLIEMLSVGRTTLRRWEEEGKFPRRRKLSGRAVGWLLSEVREWMESRPIAGGKKPHAE